YCVGKDSQSLIVQRLYLVGAVEHACCRVGGDWRGVRQKGTKVGNGTHAQAEEPSILLHRCLDVVHLTATVRLGLQILAAVLNPFDWSLAFDRQQSGDNLFPADAHLRTKGTTNLRIIHANFALIQAERTGQDTLSLVDRLRGYPGRELTRVCIKIEQAGPPL